MIALLSTIRLSIDPIVKRLYTGLVFLKPEFFGIRRALFNSRNRRVSTITKDVTMKLKPVYFVNPKTNKIEFRFNMSMVFDNAGVLDFTGYTGPELRYKFVQNLLAADYYNSIEVILHNCDHLSYDYISPCIGNREVWLVHTGIANGHCGASPQRLKNAKAYLEAKGFKVRYFASEETAYNAIQKRIAKKAKEELKRKAA